MTYQDLIRAIENCERVYLPHALPHIKSLVRDYPGDDLYYLSDDSYGLTGMFVRTASGEVGECVEEYIQRYYGDCDEDIRQHTEELMFFQYRSVHDLVMEA